MNDTRHRISTNEKSDLPARRAAERCRFARTKRSMAAFCLAAALLATPLTTSDPGGTRHAPVDPLARSDAVALLSTLRTIGSSDALIFGHHNTNFFGQDWTTAVGDCLPGGVGPTCNRSDVQLAVGQQPGMVGYNLAWVTKGGGKVQELTILASAAVKEGMILQLYWEANNPSTGGSAHDLSGNPVVELMPGGRANTQVRKPPSWPKRWANFRLFDL